LSGATAKQTRLLGPPWLVRNRGIFVPDAARQRNPVGHGSGATIESGLYRSRRQSLAGRGGDPGRPQTRLQRVEPRRKPILRPASAGVQAALRRTPATRAAA